MWNREISFAGCDAATRASGRLTKLVSVVDLNHTSFGQSTDPRFSKARGLADTGGHGLGAGGRRRGRLCGWRQLGRGRGEGRRSEWVEGGLRVLRGR